MKIFQTIKENISIYQRNYFKILEQIFQIVWKSNMHCIFSSQAPILNFSDLIGHCFHDHDRHDHRHDHHDPHDRHEHDHYHQVTHIVQLVNADAGSSGARFYLVCIFVNFCFTEKKNQIVFLFHEK